jgi:hypothetical protein
MKYFMLIATIFLAAQAHAQSRAECAVNVKRFSQTVKDADVRVAIGSGRAQTGLVFIMRDGQKMSIESQAMSMQVARSCVQAGLRLTFISSSSDPKNPKVSCEKGVCKKNTWIKLDKLLTADEFMKKVEAL